jgi:AcrR family transcriptional regulator
MSVSRREQTHQNTYDEIKAIAWEAVTQGGTSALSLGAIARKMGLTTPALYRYFKNRDALISDLIGDAYGSFTSALNEVLARTDSADHKARFRALFTVYREWAVTNPQKYFLMFGVPAPDYKLSTDAGEKADQSFLILLEEIQNAEKDGRIDFSLAHVVYTPSLRERLQAVNHRGRSYSEKETYLALTVWSFIHGLVSLEISGGYRLILGESTEDFFQLQVEHFIQSIGIQ